MQTISATLISIVAFTSITSLLIGYDLCIVSSLLKVITSEFDLCMTSSMNCFRKAFFVSMLPPGAALGSIIAGIFSDLFGRIYGLMLGDLLIAIGSVCFAFGQTYGILLLGRFIIGMGIGIGFVVFSIYVPEISPTNYRGALVAAQDCALSIGCLISYLIIALVDVQHWRILLGGVGIIAIAQFVGAFFLPESPRWLIRRDRSHDAVKSMKKLMPSKHRNISEHHHNSAEQQVAQIDQEFKAARKKKENNLTEYCRENIENSRTPSPIVDNEIGSTQATNDNQRNLQYKQKTYKYSIMKYFSLLWDYKKPLSIAIGCAVAQNFTVSNSVMYFALDVLNQAGINEDIWSGVGIGTMKFLGIFSTILLVDRLGRRFLLLYGSITTCLCLYLIAIFNAVKEYELFNVSILILACLLVYIYAWNISWAGLMFVVASEVLPTQVRATGMGLTITMFWLLSFVFQTILEPTIEVFTPKYAFSFFGTLNIFSILFVVFFVKDYTGVALENVD